MKLSLLLWATGLMAVSSAVLGGLFFVFSNFTMAALSKLSPASGMAAMQSINRTILNPVFLGLFMGNAAGALILSVAAILSWNSASSPWLLSGALLAFVGCFVITAACNVPLNNRLEAVASTDPASTEVWAKYLARWLPWNHVRTVTTILAAAAFLVALPRLGAADAGSSDTSEPAAVVRGLIEEVINKGDFELLDDLIAPHYQYRTVGNQLNGPEELAAYFAAVRSAFPDLQLRIDEQFASESKVCTAFTLTGTHSGTFLGLPPTGSPVSVAGIIISTVANGRIVSEWELLDEASLMRQLGVEGDSAE